MAGTPLTGGDSGSPGDGKTAFVLSMARNIAVDHQTPVAIFSLEMSNDQG